MCHHESHEDHLDPGAARAHRRVGAKGGRARRDHGDRPRKAGGANRGRPGRRVRQSLSGSARSPRICPTQGNADPGDGQHGDHLRGSRSPVTPVSYFDSAYIAKFYLDEPESEAIRRLGESLGRVRCAAIGLTEVAAAFHRKFREGAFDTRAFREVTAQFDDDCVQGLWTWLPLTSTVCATAAAVFARLPRSVFLRAADALHLSCFNDPATTEIY